MAVSFIQPTFASGEICPNLYARVDLAKYHAGLKLCRNFFILPQGGAANRAGTMLVGRCLNTIAGNSIGGNMPSAAAHLIPFQFNLIQTYTLEFGHLYMRVIMNGGYVLETPVTGGYGSVEVTGGYSHGDQRGGMPSSPTPTYSYNTVAYSGIPITGMTNASPGVLTVNYGAANFPTSAPYGPFNNGDQVFIAGTGTQLDSTPGRQYLVANSTSTTFTLTDLDGNAINTRNYGPISPFATASRVVTLATPYAGSDVQAIKWTQSADTLTLCHPGYPPRTSRERSTGSGRLLRLPLRLRSRRRPA